MLALVPRVTACSGGDLLRQCFLPVTAPVGIADKVPGDGKEPRDFRAGGAVPFLPGDTEDIRCEFLGQLRIVEAWQEWLQRLGQQAF